MRGKFITVEGVEGVGKSTCIEVIRSVLQGAGHTVTTSREPGGTSIGERIREIFLDGEETRMTPGTELLLMFAARAQHVSELIEPALAAGDWVVCDRFTDSSYAYQGGGRRLPEAVIEEVEAIALAGFQPDLTLLLDLNASQGLERALAGSGADRLESEPAEFYQRVREVFLQRARAHRARYAVLDASRPLPEVHRQIREIIKTFLAQEGG